MVIITNNKKTSLLNHLKKIKHSALRSVEVEKLIKKKELKNFELEPTQLRAILFLFPKLDRFKAFKKLVKHFDIKLSVLTEPEIKELSACLSQNSVFNNLLPFDKKIFAGTFPAKQNTKSVTPYSVPKRTGEGRYDTYKPNTNSRQRGNPSQAKAINRNKLSLAQLRVSFIQECPKSRLSFFKRSETNNCYQARITSMDIDEFKNFIEIFPANDAIKFLNLSLIRDQIEGFHQQNCQLEKERFIDLLNYFKSYQKESVKKLLRPISPKIDAESLRREIYKERMDEKGEYTEKLPDIIASHNISKIR